MITTLDTGGAEKHLCEQVRGQVRRGHQVRVVYLKGQGSLEEDFLAAGALEVLRAPLSPWLPVRLGRRLLWAELVHSHLLKADAVCALLATLLGRRARLVSGKHNDERALLRPWISRAHGVLGNLPARTIVLSDHVGRFVERYGRVRPEKVRRVYYGLDPSPYETAAGGQARARVRAELGLAPAEVAFVCVARFAPQKAHDVLLRAFRAALDARGPEDPPLVLLLAGDDPFGDGRARAEALARELALGPALRFLGIRRDVPELLAACDVLVMSSLWEGLGLVFLEAMASRLPILATRVSAVPEVVLEGETGLLVAPGDPAELARAMVGLARDPALRERLGRAGAARLRAVFALERMVEETLDVYRELVGDGT